MSNVTQITDPLNRITRQEFDVLNRLTKVTNAKNGITQYGFDALDQLVKVTDARNLVTNYTIDGLGNLTITASPDTGSTVTTYDEAGNIKTCTDAKGQSATYTYDALNRVTAVSYSDGTSESYLYDQGTNGLGRLSQITDISGTTQYTYDVQGRVVSEVRTIGGQSYTTGYQYDTAGRLSALTYPSGRVIEYSFDANGRISEVRTIKDGTTTVLASQIVYQPFGRLQSLVFGNGQTYARTYDLNGRMTSYTLNGQVQTVSYDAASRLIGVTDAAAPANNRTYGYDELNRLTSEQRPMSSLGYSYDAVGNRTQKVNGAATTSYTYASNSNRLTAQQGAPIVSDANGSITNNGTAQFNYDVRGRMVSANTVIGLVTYTINALGQRVQKVVPSTSTVFHYDMAGKLISEMTAAASLEYVYLDSAGGGSVPIVLFASGAASPEGYNIHSDHLDTPRLMTDQTNGAAWEWQSDGFGFSVASTGLTELRMPGQHRDAETGLHYNYYRDYDPGLGRYVQSDPIGLYAGPNSYAYVGGNPMSFVDPKGLQALPIPVPVAPPSGGAITPGGGRGSYDPRTDVYTPPPNFLPDWIRDLFDAPKTANDLPNGYWPGDRGVEEWGRRNGVGANDARRRFHGIKQGDKGRPKDVYGVNPNSGDVCNPDGDHAGNLGEVKPK